MDLGVYDIVKNRFYEIKLYTKEKKCYENGMFSNAIEYKNKIYLIPFAEESIVRVNIENDDVSIVNLEQNEKLGLKYKGSEKVEDKVYLSPFYGRNIGVLELQ